jgi:hypothetical protein
MIHLLNDSSPPRTGTLATLCVVNIAAALASGAFGAAALVAPATLVGAPVSSDRATEFFVGMYAIRSFVIAARLIAASVMMRRAPRVAAIALSGGGLVQLGDIAIAARVGTPGVVGAAVAAAVHLASAGLLAASVRTSR